jgi:hypothetical protein
MAYLKNIAKKNLGYQAWWCTPVILAMQEADGEDHNSRLRLNQQLGVV